MLTDGLPAARPRPAADVRVIKSVQAGRGGRVRDEAEAAQASSITVTNDGREKTVPAGQAGAAAAAPAPVAASAAATPENVAEARAWIAAWKAKQGAGAEALPENVAEAREWIRRWRAANLEKRLPSSAVSSQ